MTEVLRAHTTQLQAGLAMLQETRDLLRIYQPGQTATQLSEAALAAVQRGQREALPHQTFRLSSCCRSLHAMTIETTGWRDLRFAALTDKPETATWYLADTSVFSGSYKEQCGNPS